MFANQIPATLPPQTTHAVSNHLLTKVNSQNANITCRDADNNYLAFLRFVNLWWTLRTLTLCKYLGTYCHSHMVPDCFFFSRQTTQDVAPVTWGTACDHRPCLTARPPNTIRGIENSFLEDTQELWGGVQSCHRVNYSMWNEFQLTYLSNVQIRLNSRPGNRSYNISSPVQLLLRCMMRNGIL